MYIRTAEGLGQNQETWSASQLLNQDMVRPGPIGYLGNFYEYLGSPKQTCYTVDNFRPDSWLLTKDIQLHLDKIAKTIVQMIERKLRKFRLKSTKEARVRLYIEFRGHMDKKTDTLKPASMVSSRPGGYQGLDSHRLVEVHHDLKGRVESKLKTQNLHGRFKFSYDMGFSYSPEGSAHPISSKVPDKNRRVEVCILSLSVKKL